MSIRNAGAITASEITDKQVYLARRRFMQAGAGLGVAGVLGLAGMPHLAQGKGAGQGLRPLDYTPGAFSTDEQRTSYRDVTTYNNFYEFGTDKSSPARLAHTLKTTPWSVAIEGEVNKPGVYHLEDILRPEALQERIYRHRCVEGWSMVIPWVGFPLADLLTRFEPTGKARFVQFTTLYDPKEMPGQRRDVLDWPYVEGLRLDEAMHPLTLLAVGLYGEVLPNQNGAPLRLVVPWKYGFKSIKSIVKIRLMEHPPVSTWTRAAANEYGFYANVNPQVDHPRWSQRTERRIGEFFKRKTLMFNGYGEQVAGLYTGMDLKKYF